MFFDKVVKEIVKDDNSIVLKRGVGFIDTQSGKTLYDYGAFVKLQEHFDTDLMEIKFGYETIGSNSLVRKTYVRDMILTRSQLVELVEFLNHFIQQKYVNKKPVVSNINPETE